MLEGRSRKSAFSGGVGAIKRVTFRERAQGELIEQILIASDSATYESQK